MSWSGKFKTNSIESMIRAGEVRTATVAGTTANIRIMEFDEDHDAVHCTGTDVPTDTTSGYAKGCIFIDTDVATGTTGRYENVGTNTSCNFDIITGVIGADSVDTAELADDAVTAAKLADAAVTLVGAATSAEIVRACDVSARVVALTATTAITELLHEGKVCVITGTDAATYTLPEATGSGATYRFLINEVNTSNNILKTADTTNCGYYGIAHTLDLDAAAQTAYAPASTDDLMTMNGTTTGGAIGDRITLIDMAADKWYVDAQLQVPTSSNPATPFSGT